jgi:WD40 repeat protein/Flp pilus assembly protein TadD
MTQDSYVRIHPIRGFSPDGRRFVTGCNDGKVRIWDAATGKLTVPAMKHRHFTGASFSPDGRWVLSRSFDGDNSARVWDAATGAPRCDPMRHPAGVILAEFTPDGTRVITMCDDHAVRVWDAATGRLLLPPLWHLGPLTMIQVGADGRHVLSVSVDRTVRLWDLAGAGPAGPRLPTPGGTYWARSSPDGRLLITDGAGPVARVWDVATGSPAGPDMSHPEGVVVDAQFSPDGRSLATLVRHGSNRRVDGWLWDLATRRVKQGPLMIHRAPDPSGKIPRAYLVWSHDGRRLAAQAGSHAWAPPPLNTAVRIWEAQTGTAPPPPLTFDTAVFGLEFSPDGRSLLLACGGRFETNRLGDARLLDASTGTLRFPPITAPQVCAAARFSPDGRRLVTAMAEGEARVWDASDGRPLTPPLRHTSPVEDAFFTPDGRLVVTVSDAVRLWDATTGMMVLPPMRFPLPVGSAVISSDGRRLLVTCGGISYNPDPGFSQVLDVATGWPVTPPLWREQFIPEARFSPDGHRVVTPSKGGDTLLWDLKPDGRSLDDLIRMTEILSGTRVDHTGTAVPISTSELQDSHEALMRKAPGTFTATPEQVLGWHHQQAQLCAAAGAWGAAVKHLDRLIEDGPRVDVLIFRRGLAMRRQGKLSEAIAEYREAIRLAPDTMELHRELGQALWSTGRPDEAIAEYREAIRIKPVDPLAQNDLAWYLATSPDPKLRDPAQAVEVARKAVEKKQHSDVIWNTLGVALYRTSDWKGAIEALEKAEALAPDKSLAYNGFFLAMARWQLGDKQQARTWYEQAVQWMDKTQPQNAELHRFRAEAAELLSIKAKQR